MKNKLRYSHILSRAIGQTYNLMNLTRLMVVCFL